MLTLLVTHTAQCAPDNMAILTFAFQGLSNWYLGFCFNERMEKGSRICFYSCNSLEHHFLDWKRGVSILVGTLGQKVLGSGWN